MFVNPKGCLSRRIPLEANKPDTDFELHFFH